MDRSDIRIDITLRLDCARSPAEIQQILNSLSTLDGIGAMRLGDASGKLLRIGFDPYRLSARDILKWFAQQTVKASLLPAAGAAVSVEPSMPITPLSQQPLP